MRVCNRFLRGWCTRTTCRMAHPGIRDGVEPIVLSGSGARRKFGVMCCPVARACGGDWNQCPEGNKCKYRHPYLRPSTINIVRKLYPMRRGRAVKYRGGAKLDGMMDEDEHGEANYNGYQDLHLAQRGHLHGRLDEGHPLRKRHLPVGQRQGVRGPLGGRAAARLGVLSHANGGVYEEFRAGRADGLGHLQSANGDTYDGQFENNKFHGRAASKSTATSTSATACAARPRVWASSPSRAEKSTKATSATTSATGKACASTPTVAATRQLGRGSGTRTSGCS